MFEKTCKQGRLIWLHSMKWESKGAQQQRQKKTAAKETILTGKETRTKAETTSGQAIAMRQKKRQKCEYKKGKNDRKKVETSENATAKVMSNLSELFKRVRQLDVKKGLSICKEAYGMVHERHHGLWWLNERVEAGFWWRQINGKHIHI